MDKQLFNQECLNAHNTLRGLHSCPPLKIDNEITESAQAHADHLANENKFEHSDSQGKYGENLFKRTFSDPSHVLTGEQAALNWYEEIKDYKFGEECSGMGTGHFSQVVWKSSEKCGFGVAKTEDGSFVVVGRYVPAGNFIGRHIENVPAPKKDYEKDPIFSSCENGAPKAGPSSKGAAGTTDDKAAKTKGKGNFLTRLFSGKKSKKDKKEKKCKGDKTEKAAGVSASGTETKTLDDGTTVTKVVSSQEPESLTGQRRNDTDRMTAQNKETKTRTCGDEKTVTLIVTETFCTKEGEEYTVTKETVEQVNASKDEE